MDVFFVVALSGLFLFLGLKYQQSQFTKQVDKLIEESAHIQTDLELKIHLMESKVSDYGNLQLELEKARQIQASTVPLELHLTELSKSKNILSEVEGELEQVKGQLDDVKGKQISERVRLGLVSENVAPFLNAFPYDPKTVRGLFNPIDLLVFKDDEIVFVEIKTGDAKLTDKQRNIKRLVEEGRVRFEVHRISDKGHEIK